MTGTGKQEKNVCAFRSLPDIRQTFRDCSGRSCSSSVSHFSLGVRLSFVRNLVFELGFVFLLPALLGSNGIWLAVDAADLCTCILGVALILDYRKRYGY